MSKLRSVSTKIWSDTWFEDLTPNQKLLFIYLITNEKTNMLGIYEVSFKKISFETGIQRSEVEKAIKIFEEAGPVRYEHNHIILTKFLKHQNFNTNMKKSAIDVYNELPKELKDKGLNLSKETVTESFERLSNHLGMVRKIEVEYEYELEVEKEEEEEEEKKEVYFLDDVLLNEKFEEFIKFRKELRKKMTPTTIKKAVEKLNRYDSETAIKMLEQSMANGWQGIFELKENNQNGGKQTNNGSRIERFLNG